MSAHHTGRQRWLLPLFAVMLLSAADGGDPATPTPERLGGKDRAVSFLSTDKPIYKTGEAVYLRAVTLQAGTFFPVRENRSTARLIITGPRGEEVVRQTLAVTDSTAGFAWTVPADMAGGRYTASVEVDHGPPAVRPFEIRVYSPPRLKSRIEFLREGYGPGDTVTAVASVTRAEGGVPAGARVTVVARVDGGQVALVPDLSVGEDGTCRVSFDLPGRIERGDGSLAFIIEDGGVTETASKTIPILLQTLDLTFFPEGGELVAGLSGRMYVQARRLDGKPADIAGDIVRVDAEGRALDGESRATLETTHEGRGIVELTPRGGERYALRINRPSGLERLFPLPPVRDGGAVIAAKRPAYAFGDPILLTVRSTPDANAALVTLYQREKLLAKADVGAGETAVSLDAGDAEGVLMATVWDAAGKPLAERLVFRRPKFAVYIDVSTDTVPGGTSPTPGGRVRLKVSTTNESGHPVEAVVGLTVTDDALLEMVEKRDQAPGLPVMAYLENEVLDLADAHVYFDAGNPGAARDIDLLLGTQGWRRFVLVRLDEALREQPEAVRRALAMRSPPPPRPSAVFAPGAWFEDGIVEGAVPVFAAASQEEQFAMMDGRVDVEAVLPLQGMREQEFVIVDEDAAMIPALPEPQAEPLPPAMIIRQDVKEELALRDAKVIPGVMEKRRAAQKPVPYVAVREYAHQARPNRRPNDRVDFAETLYWTAGVRTNPRDGTAAVEFDLSDSVTTFRVRADAFGNNGALGEATAELASVEPFYIEPKFPPVVVAGDRVDIPVVMVNATAAALDRPGLVARCEGLKLVVDDLPDSLGAGTRDRVMVRLTADTVGEFTLSLNAAAGGYADNVARTFTVLPRGFPVQQAAGGLVGPEKPYAWQLTVAADVMPGSMRTSAKVHPTPLANMREALNALLQRPHGCFEQTSSTSYPLVMAQQYFLGHAGVSPDTVRRAGELLDESYRKLVGFECPEKGYEWFGGDPGHEALTAYGLMQFIEMKKVMPVDDAMIARTRNWLLSRRDGSGGFKRNDRALDSFGAAPVPLTNLYILWTLLESGEKPGMLMAEIAAAKKLVAETKDPYLLALGANVLFLAGDPPAARAAADAVVAKQDKDGSLPGAETSITRSGGESLAIETVSFAVLAWLRCGDEYAGAVEKSMAWLFECCKAGRFGSTQSTILALKAINAYDAARSKPKAPGSVQLLVDGKPFGHAVVFDEKSQGALELPDFSAALSPGSHRVELSMTGGGEMPFALAVEYNTPRPADSPDCPLSLTTALSERTVREGELVDMTVKVSAGSADVPMPLAVIGLPAGLEPRHERLKEMVAAGRMAAYEIVGRELVLYWRAFKADEARELPIPLVAHAPGLYGAPASRVYAYYLDEHKRWAAGETVEILSR